MYLGDEALRVDVLQERGSAKDGSRRAEARVPAGRSSRAVGTGYRYHRSAEGRGCGDGRHRNAATGTTLTEGPAATRTGGHGRLRAASDTRAEKTMDVTDILRDRIHEPAGLQRMTAVSVLLHGLLAVVVILAPGSWFSKRVELPRSLMTSTLGGGNTGAGKRRHDIDWRAPDSGRAGARCTQAT